MNPKTERSMISNVANEHKSITLQAITEAGFDIIIEDKAYDTDNQLIPDCFSLWSKDPRDHGLFWQIWEENYGLAV